MPLYKINHITRYTYASPVIDCTNQVMLYPIEDENLEIRSHKLSVTNNPVIETFTDHFGNTIGVFSNIQPHHELSIESKLEVTTKSINFPEETHSAAGQWQHLLERAYDLEFIDFLGVENYSSIGEVKDIIQQICRPDLTPLFNAQILNTYIYQNFSYQPGATDVETKMDKVWELKAGVCQDFAHVLLVMLRMAGIPAKYISGYICPQMQHVRGEGATHAWVEAYIPHYGWLGLDPTNNCLVNEYHVKLAVGRSFNDCTPVKGTYKGSSTHTLEVSVNIESDLPGRNEPIVEETKFTYKSVRQSEKENSYTKFIEIQQQQQQQ